MAKDGRGWHKESKRHSLAARGIPSDSPGSFGVTAVSLAEKAAGSSSSELIRGGRLTEGLVKWLVDANPDKLDTELRNGNPTLMRIAKDTQKRLYRKEYPEKSILLFRAHPDWISLEDLEGRSFSAWTQDEDAVREMAESSIGREIIAAEIPIDHILLAPDSELPGDLGVLMDWEGEFIVMHNTPSPIDLDFVLSEDVM